MCTFILCETRFHSSLASDSKCESAVTLGFVGFCPYETRNDDKKEILYAPQYSCLYLLEALYHEGLLCMHNVCECMSGGFCTTIESIHLHHFITQSLVETSPKRFYFHMSNLSIFFIFRTKIIHILKLK